MKTDQPLTCVGKYHLVGLQLLLGELGHRVGRPGGEADHAAVRGGDGEGQTLVRAVHVHRAQLRVGDDQAGARPHRQPRVVDQPGDGVVDRSDLDLQGGGDAGLVLVRPVQSHRPRHQDEAVEAGVGAVMKVLQHTRVRCQVSGGDFLYVG